MQRRVAILWACGILLGLAGRAHAEETWTPLFNGKDLSGWTSMNLPPGTFYVKDGILITRGHPTGVIRSDKMYENFVLEMEWKHIEKVGNSGLFVWSDGFNAPGSPYCRCIEVQVLNGMETANYTSHGDVFALNGTVMKPDRPHPLGWMRCLPSERLAKGTGEWNHYRIEARDGRITLAVNGKVVSGGSGITPRKGFLCLESEGAETHFRNLRIQELPSTNPKQDEICLPPIHGEMLYNGLDFSGWKVPKDKTGWEAKDSMLLCNGKGTVGSDGTIWTERELENFELRIDWHWAGKPVERLKPVFLPSGEPATDADGKPQEVKVPDAGESGILLRGSEKARVALWCLPGGSGTIEGYRADKSLPPEVRAACMASQRTDQRFAMGRVAFIAAPNRSIITVIGDRVTIETNGKRVINNARLPGLPAKGPLGLQNLGATIEFSNLYLRSLPKPATGKQD